jgi:peptide/nickel transport system ATP-binding protein
VTDPTSSVHEETPAPGAEPAALEARSLTKHFPVRRGWGLRGGAVVHAVEDVSLVLRRGTVTAVVGESGSGKSTLARMLARLIKPTSGEVLLNGEPAPDGGRTYAGLVQLVLQDPFASLNPIHGMRYILGRPLKIHGTAEGRASDEAIQDLLRRVALTPAEQFIEKLPHELSGGQRQRVAIARALAARPQVLLADEPVSMLDVSIRLGVLNLLAGLRDRERLAILYVTHDIASARYRADSIAVMYAGRVVRLPVPPALPVRDGQVRRADAPGLRGRPRSDQRLLAPRDLFHSVRNRSGGRHHRHHQLRQHCQLRQHNNHIGTTRITTHQCTASSRAASPADRAERPRTIPPRSSQEMVGHGRLDTTECI